MMLKPLNWYEGTHTSHKQNETYPALFADVGNHKYYVTINKGKYWFMGVPYETKEDALEAADNMYKQDAKRMLQQYLGEPIQLNRTKLTEGDRTPNRQQEADPRTQYLTQMLLISQLLNISVTGVQLGGSSHDMSKEIGAVEAIQAQITDTLNMLRRQV